MIPNNFGERVGLSEEDLRGNAQNGECVDKDFVYRGNEGHIARRDVCNVRETTTKK